MLNICGKNDVEDRDAPLSREAKQHIDHWLHVRPILSQYIFTSFGGHGDRPNAKRRSAARRSAVSARGILRERMDGPYRWWIKNGKIAVVGFGRAVRIPAAEFDQALCDGIPADEDIKTPLLITA